jgi:hypothetical protein
MLTAFPRLARLRGEAATARPRCRSRSIAGERWRVVGSFMATMTLVAAALAAVIS